jgi:hypothetical protein
MPFKQERAVLYEGKINWIKVTMNFVITFQRFDSESLERSVRICEARNQSFRKCVPMLLIELRVMSYSVWSRKKIGGAVRGGGGDNEKKK